MENRPTLREIVLEKEGRLYGPNGVKEILNNMRYGTPLKLDKRLCKFNSKSIWQSDAITIRWEPQNEALATQVSRRISTDINRALVRIQSGGKCYIYEDGKKRSSRYVLNLDDKEFFLCLFTDSSLSKRFTHFKQTEIFSPSGAEFDFENFKIVLNETRKLKFDQEIFLDFAFVAAHVLHQN